MSRLDGTELRPQRQSIMEAHIDGGCASPVYGCPCGAGGTYWTQNATGRFRVNRDGSPHKCRYTKQTYEHKT